MHGQAVIQLSLAGFGVDPSNRVCPVCCAPLGANPAQKVCSGRCRTAKHRIEKRLAAVPNGVWVDFLAQKGVTVLQPSVTPSQQNGDLAAVIDRQNNLIEKQNAIIERLLTAAPPSQTIASTPPQIQQNKVQIDDLENDERLDLTIEEAKTEQQAGWNLHLSMAKHGIGCTFLELPLEALEYGLKQGDFGITPEIIAQKRAMLAEKNPPKGKGAGKSEKPHQGQAKPIVEAEKAVFTTPADLDDLDLGDW